MDQCRYRDYSGNTNTFKHSNTDAVNRNQSSTVFLTEGDIWKSCFLLHFRLWNDTIQSKESFYPQATNSQLLAVSGSHLKVRGSLSHLSPRVLLLVITQAAITRPRRTRTHSLDARQQRSWGLWIQISMQTLCWYCRTSAPACSSIWVTLVMSFERHKKSWRRSRTSGTSHFCQLALYLKAKKKSLLCEDFFYSVWWFQHFFQSHSLKCRVYPSQRCFCWLPKPLWQPPS